MTFADLGAGETIFLDANLFVYHFVADPLYGAACSQLLQRVENQEIRGLTSTLHFPRKPIGEQAPADEISPPHLRGRKLPQPWSLR